MNRNLASALAIAGTAAVAVVLAATSSGKAHADDITVDTTPFVSSRSRADVQAELIGRPDRLRASAGEQYKQMSQLKSAYTGEQARSQYKASRDEVQALTGEDSGSAWFLKSRVRPGANPATTMGGAAR